MNFWVPFVPLYMKQLEEMSDAGALLWTGLASGAMGIARLVAGPVWGVLSDRYGRKSMFLRALYCASLTMAVAAFATRPWHIVAAFALQGLFSGFIPAATALTSVSVPDRRLNSALSAVTAAQYIGNTLGPAIGAGLAALVGYRGAILGGAALPAIAGLFATFAVPRDRIGPSRASSTDAAPATETPRDDSIRALLTVQFVLVLAVWFLALSFSQLLRIAAPIAIERLVPAGEATKLSGVAFTISGLGGVVGVIAAQRWIRPGLLRASLVVTSVGVGISHFLLPLPLGGAALFIASFSVIAMLQAAQVPATNTLIAANAPRERRGTAFGLASGVQAVAFMVGPMTAAGFAAVSLNLGFVVLGAASLLLALLIHLGLREPRL